MANRHRLALFVLDLGAANPVGVVRLLATICNEAKAERQPIEEDAAVRLIVAYLATLCRASASDLQALAAECQRINSEPKGTIN